jgi:hypothetical protein
MILKFEDFINEKTSGEIFKPKRNKPVVFDKDKYPEIAQEIYDLIQVAYAPIGGHLKVKSPADIISGKEWNFWEGIDIHGDSDFDIVMFGKKTKYGIKFSGVGHDGEKDSKRAYLDERGKDLKTLGHYIEVSEKIAEILVKKYNVPIISDPEIVNKILGKNVEWVGKSPNYDFGDGWYIRKIAGHPHEKILLGKPKI